jgi:hypothetical protein
MNYIKGHCRTNLDYYDCSKVNKFVAIPNIGDRVAVTEAGINRHLYVVSVIHDMRDGDPHLEIELGKMNPNLHK